MEDAIVFQVPFTLDSYVYLQIMIIDGHKCHSETLKRFIKRTEHFL